MSQFGFNLPRGDSARTAPELADGGDGVAADLEGTLIGKDGESYSFRSIRASDAGSLMRGYDAMSDESKWSRLLTALPHLSEEMAARFCTPDPAQEVCLVIEGRGALAGEILGGARVAGLDPGKRAEFAVSLRPEARGLGLARQVLQAAIEVARARGCSGVWGTISAENLEMLRLARRMGMTVERDHDDWSIETARLDFAAPEPGAA